MAFSLQQKAIAYYRPLCDDWGIYNTTRRLKSVEQMDHVKAL